MAEKQIDWEAVGPELLAALKAVLAEFENIYSAASSCVAQRAPSDDAIIAEEIIDIRY